MDIKIDADVYLELLDRRYEQVADNWGRHDALFEQFLHCIEECGISGDSDPSVVVDSFLINGEFTTKDDWQTDYPSMYDYYDGNFDRFAESEGIFWTGEEVCLRC